VRVKGKREEWSSKGGTFKCGPTLRATQTTPHWDPHGSGLRFGVGLKVGGVDVGGMGVGGST